MGNRTGDLSVCGMTLQPTEPQGQGNINIFLCQGILTFIRTDNHYQMELLGHGIKTGWMFTV